jgi:hypothetical protein
MGEERKDRRGFAGMDEGKKSYTQRIRAEGVIFARDDFNYMVYALTFMHDKGITIELLPDKNLAENQLRLRIITEDPQQDLGEYWDKVDELKRADQENNTNPAT